MAKRKAKRIYQNKMWKAARLYCKEAEKCTKARAYFMAIVARGCELEALLRIYDFVETKRPKNRCYNLKGLIDRAFKASGVSAKPAMRGHFKTGHMRWPGT